MLPRFFARLSHRRLLPALAICLAFSLMPTASNVRAISSSQAAQTTTPTQTAQPSTGKPILLTDSVPDPHQPGVQFFSATGHTLRGSFLDYWQQNGGLAQFGYPLTEEFTEPLGPNNSPIMVQYFERNRFEHHPENGAEGTPNEVLLGTLGRAFHTQDAPAPQLPAPADYFPQTGHNLSGTFQAYWHSHGGLAIYGYPITEQFQEQSPTDHKTYTVQYFERARMELHPENAGTAYEVLLGQLGTQLSQKNGYPYGWYPPYGQAADYSWVAGKILLSVTAACDHPECGCSLLEYNQSDNAAIFQLDSYVWSGIADLGKPFSVHYEGDFLVVFGRRALPGERYFICRTNPAAPGYLPDRVQKNPGR